MVLISPIQRIVESVPRPSETVLAAHNDPEPYKNTHVDFCFNVSQFYTFLCNEILHFSLHLLRAFIYLFFLLRELCEV